MELIGKLMAIRGSLLSQCARNFDNRERILKREHFALALIFGCILSAGKDRSIDGLCRAVKRLTRKKIARSDFRKKIDTRVLTKYLTIAFGKLVTQVAEKDSSVYAKVADQLSVRGIFV